MSPTTRSSHITHKSNDRSGKIAISTKNVKSPIGVKSNDSIVVAKTIRRAPFKVNCGKLNSLGKSCKNKRVLGLDTCINHSDDDSLICGHLNKKSQKCKQLLGKCVYHNQPSIVKSVQSKSMCLNGDQCNNTSNSSKAQDSSLLCGYTNTKSGSPCKNIKSNCSSHKKLQF